MVSIWRALDNIGFYLPYGIQTGADRTPAVQSLLDQPDENFFEPDASFMGNITRHHPQSSNCSTPGQGLASWRHRAR